MISREAAEQAAKRFQKQALAGNTPELHQYTAIFADVATCVNYILQPPPASPDRGWSEEKCWSFIAEILDDTEPKWQDHNIKSYIEAKVAELMGGASDDGEPVTEELQPVGKCPKCGRDWYSSVGFCGGCTTVY